MTEGTRAAGFIVRAEDLPIAAILPEIRAKLLAGPNLVLVAPPGAGKTTAVPLALLDLLPAPGQQASQHRILVLQPRRLATRAAAQRMAALLDEAPGGRVGYRVRLERRIGPMTRIEAVTTGLFLRQIQADPGLDGVAAVIFDEFHERAIEADLALAFAIEAQAGLRPDLRLIVMSATLDGARVARLLPDARELVSAGRQFPIETRHLGDDPAIPVADRVAQAVRIALADSRDDAFQSTDILAFLPGAAEIRRAERLLGAALDATRFAVLALHGEMALGDQDRVLSPDPQGRRKIVLATSIAETSLTIPGIGIVIDGGRKRRPSFDPGSGMTRLLTTRVSRAAADQRRGRAGRTAPGRCYRLWSEAEERAFEAFDPPEILGVDLAPLALELAAWGALDPGALELLDPPPKVLFDLACTLLRKLDAVDDAGRITAAGKRMAGLGLHPRLGHMLLRALDWNEGALATDLAAVLAERDPLRNAGADIAHRVDLLRRGGDGAGWSRIRRQAEAWRRQLGIAADRGPADPATAGRLLALAYPDRIAMRRGGIGQFRLANGRGAVLPPEDSLATAPFLVAAHLDGDKRDARIFLAAPIERETIVADFADRIESRDSVIWNPRSESVEARRQRLLDSLAIEDRPLPDPDPDLVASAMLDGIRALGLGALPWSEAASGLRARIAFLRQVDGEAWPDLGDGALLAALPDWLGPYLSGIGRRAHIERLDMAAILAARLDHRQRQRLDRMAPTHLTVPSGSRVAVDYAAENGPVLAVRLQEMFGATDTPALAEGKVPVLLHLLSPGRRPVQVTRDLAGFWRNAYRAVRADLRGQYPRHAWPEDPLAALPTARAKPRGT